MALKEIKLPDLGEGVTEGELLKILVSVGDRVVMDQVLLEVMTDKASMEIPGILEGVIKEVKAKEGDMVAVGQVILLLETEEEENFSDRAGQAGKVEQVGKAGRETSKKDRTGISTAGAAENKTAGPEKNPLEKSEFSAESRLPQTARSSGFAGTSSGPSSSAGAEPFPSGSEGLPLSAPATRRLARELNIDLKSVKTSGGEGQVTREDLINHVRSALKSPPPAPSFPFEGEIVETGREPLRGIRRIMFETMTLSKQTIPHFTIMERAEVRQLVKIRRELKERGEKQGVKITYLPFIMKAVLSALKTFPLLNSHYDGETKEIVFTKSCHFGFAVDTEKGLLVPVIRDVQEKSLLEIAKELKSLGEKARAGTLQREELKGGTFTFTNLGSIGGIAGTPIIHPPQAAIFGIYRIYHQPARNLQTGEWEETPYMNFSLTCDHRFIDGACSARFLKACTAKIEEPGLLVLD